MQVTDEFLSLENKTNFKFSSIVWHETESVLFSFKSLERIDGINNFLNSIKKEKINSSFTFISAVGR